MERLLAFLTANPDVPYRQADGSVVYGRDLGGERVVASRAGVNASSPVARQAEATAPAEIDPNDGLDGALLTPLQRKQLEADGHTFTDTLRPALPMAESPKPFKAKPRSEWRLDTPVGPRTGHVAASRGPEPLDGSLLTSQQAERLRAQGFAVETAGS